MRTLQDIRITLNKHKSDLLNKYPIKSMAIFGSFARNEQTDDSDLDLMVEFNDKIGIRFIDLADELEDYIGIRVDLVSRKGLKDRYFRAIKSELVYV
jgi:predicted nucleotidyltransferase